ncbi:hypothetical protein JZ751_021463 [Albula glossodonta]|uniref:Uncharacterized protein n=1 Tax=Albula glossodonta TaxID=121402 RepID=A0A8T2NM95_9TELE|nr:hypothetical protein JZ751_021463 [Albula glossodonta]
MWAGRALTGRAEGNSNFLLTGWDPSGGAEGERHGLREEGSGRDEGRGKEGGREGEERIKGKMVLSVYQGPLQAPAESILPDRRGLNGFQVWSERGRCTLGFLRETTGRGGPKFTRACVLDALLFRSLTLLSPDQRPACPCQDPVRAEVTAV